MGLKQIREKILGHVPVSELVKLAKSQGAAFIESCSGSSSSIVISALARTFPNLVVIFPDEERARFAAGDLETLGTENVRFFPVSNHKPYQDASLTDSATLVQRAEVLDAIVRSESTVLVTSAAAVGEKVISPQAFSKSALSIQKNDMIGLEPLREKLLDSGYAPTSFVDHPGEFAVRGGIFDIFPFSGDYPVRLEFFGDEVDSIRHFDPDSQRSISFLDHVRIVPNSLTLDSNGRQQLLSYFPDGTLYILFDQPLILSELENQFQLADDIYGVLKSHKDRDPDDFLPDPSYLFATPAQISNQIKKAGRLYFGNVYPKDEAGASKINIGARPQPDFNSSIKLLKDDIAQHSSDGILTHILCDHPGQKDRFEDLLGEPSAGMDYTLSVETLHEGFILKDAGIAVYTDHQVFNRYHRPKVRPRKFSGGISFKELKDLNIGDYVVHVDYGIGRFRGFQKIKVKNSEQEVVVLQYHGDSILYVNVTQLFKIQKYSGRDGHQPKITKLGSTEWARKKEKTRSRVKDIARELILLYAKRKAQKAHAFPPDNYMQTEMEVSFMYEETPDQLKAIEDVKRDMQSDTPMDRLICGDVGFGKTEVAIRAAFKAALDGKQAAVLVPTTILADQHFKTFTDRLGNFPVKIGLLSRFVPAAEQKITIEGLKKGEVDILIGTHRITSKDVEFHDLGLLVIDEEQRFGVATKEKIKRFRASVDVLTMTATPIPRTLQFSLMGARDLSVINTPPPNRQPVQTEILTFDSQAVRDAILYEISRGGQVFFIHNRVKNIAEISTMISQLVPNVKVRFAHGQMRGTELEKIIMDFYANKFDVLVSTNIVENGIDIANTNTIIINQAHQFGLSELHQLRGRVGRSNRKAFCYLIAPPFTMLPMESRKRLMAIVEFSDIGSGLNIAMRDLDIRGAGDILGGEQSGFIQEVGFELYTKILNEAVSELKKEEFPELFDDGPVSRDLPETTVEFDLPALLPAWYIFDNVERLNLYRRLATATTNTTIDEWQQELADRFGKLPDEALNLIMAARIKHAAAKLLITRVTIRAGRAWLQCPDPNTEIGQLFYGDGLMQQLIAKIQDAGKPVEASQKQDTLRIIVMEIPDLDAALNVLLEVGGQGGCDC